MLRTLYIENYTESYYLDFAFSASSGAPALKHSPLQFCEGLAWFLCLMVLASLSGCGPGVSDHTPNPGARASVGLSSEPKPASQNTSATSLVPSSAVVASNSATASAAQEESALPDNLALPTWIAQALDAPDVSVRLKALDVWAQQGTHAPLDPLLVALDDEDDDVREKAMAIIERQWVLEQDAEPHQ